MSYACDLMRLLFLLFNPHQNLYSATQRLTPRERERVDAIALTNSYVAEASGWDPMDTTHLFTCSVIDHIMNENKPMPTILLLRLTPDSSVHFGFRRMHGALWCHSLLFPSMLQLLPMFTSLTASKLLLVNIGNLIYWTTWSQRSCYDIQQGYIIEAYDIYWLHISLAIPNSDRHRDGGIWTHESLPWGSSS